jgi:O-antigen/teichoic acid export membrane protein
MTQAKYGSTLLRLGGKSFWSFASLGSRLVSNTLVVFVQARLLGAGDFGHLALALSCAAIWSLFLDFGSILHAMRAVAVNPSSAAQQIRSDARMRALLVAPLFVIACVISWLLNPGGLFFAFLIIHAAVAVGICAEYNSAILRGLGEYRNESFVSALGYAAYGVIAVVVLVYFPDLTAAAISLFMGRLIGFGIGLFALARLVPNLFSSNIMDTVPLRSNFARTLPYAKDVIIANSMNQIDMAMVGWLFEPVSIGVYAVAFRIFQIVNQFVGALSTIFIPSLAANQGDRAANARILKVLLATTLFWSAASLLGLNLVGGGLASALGKSFIGLNSFMPIIGVATAARIVASGSAMALTGVGLQIFRVKSLMIGFIVLVASGAVGGAYFGLRAYLWAGALTFAVITILQIFSLYKYYYYGVPRSSLRISANGI